MKVDKLDLEETEDVENLVLWVKAGMFMSCVPLTRDVYESAVSYCSNTAFGLFGKVVLPRSINENIASHNFQSPPVVNSWGGSTRDTDNGNWQPALVTLVRGEIPGPHVQAWLSWSEQGTVNP